MAAVPRHRYGLGTAVIVLTLLAAGCGGGDGSNDAPSNPETSSSAGDDSSGSYDPGDGSTPAPYPCDQLTADEVGTLLGGTYTFKEGPQGQCDFDPESTALPTSYVAIEHFKRDFPTFLDANPGATEVDVAMGGFIVADDPDDITIKNGYAQLTKDGVTLSVVLVNGEQAVRDGKIEELLTLAASKL